MLIVWSTFLLSSSPLFYYTCLRRQMSSIPLINVNIVSCGYCLINADQKYKGIITPLESVKWEGNMTKFGEHVPHITPHSLTLNTCCTYFITPHWKVHFKHLCLVKCGCRLTSTTAIRQMFPICKAVSLSYAVISISLSAYLICQFSLIAAAFYWLLHASSGCNLCSCLCSAFFQL